MTHPELAPYLQRYVGVVGVGEIVVKFLPPDDSWMVKAVNPVDGIQHQRLFFEQRLIVLRARLKLVGNLSITPLPVRLQALVTGSASDLYEVIRPGGPIERDGRFEVPFGMRWQAAKSNREQGQLSPRL